MFVSGVITPEVFEVRLYPTMAECYRGGRVLIFQEKAKVLHDDVCVVIRFEEPISVVEMMFVNIVECLQKIITWVYIFFFLEEIICRTNGETELQNTE